MTSLMDELDTLETELEEAKKRVKKFKDLIAQASRVQLQVSQQVVDHKKRLAQLSKDLKPHTKVADAAESAALDQRLTAMRRVVRASDKIRPSTGSLFVRLFLGRVNVRVAQEVDKTRLRDEYNKFKERTNVMFCVLPLLNMVVFYNLRGVWANTNWCHILTHVWMLYYYVSLALRENILRVNGSNIRPWWIYHHYLSSFMSIILLTWPIGPHAASFLPQFYVYCLTQGVVQFMQAAYQKKRLYIRKAIGKAGPMDVNQTETIIETPSELYLLLLFIFGVHIFQIFNGVSLGIFVFHNYDGNVAWYDFAEEVQATTVAALFVILGVVNFQQTVMVLVDKKRHNERVKKQLSSRRLLKKRASSGAGAGAGAGTGSGPSAPASPARSGAGGATAASSPSTAGGLRRR